jgi:hypothetical protein
MPNGFVQTDNFARNVFAKPNFARSRLFERGSHATARRHNQEPTGLII